MNTLYTSCKWQCKNVVAHISWYSHNMAKLTQQCYSVYHGDNKTSQWHVHTCAFTTKLWSHIDRKPHHNTCPSSIPMNIIQHATWEMYGFPLAIKSLHLLLTDILTVAQVAVVSYQTIPQYWCRKNKNATGKGDDYKCLGPCSMCRRTAWRYVKVVH